jgi:parvulin-like peptidyl-prolyl isomerase
LKKFGSLILVVLFMMVGCSGSDKGVSALGKDSTMVARVGDKVISSKQIDKFLENLPPQVSSRYGAARIRREIADGFISMETLAWEARKRGIDKREDVKLKMELIVDQSLARELEEDIRKGIKVSDADTKKYYDEHQNKYGARPRVFARQIMLTTEPEAKSVADKIKKGGNFEDLAKQLSKDQETAPKGGDIGLVTPGKLDPALEKAVFSLKEGETSPIVKTAKGFYILKAERVASSKEKSYEEMKKSIENLIMREKVNKAVSDLKVEVKKNAKVEVNEKYFAQFKDAVPAPNPLPTPGAEPAE